MLFKHFDFVVTMAAAVPPIQAPLPNEHSAHLRDSGDFKEKPDWSRVGKFQRTAGGRIFNRIQAPATIGIIWGQLKSQGDQAAFPQALNFPTESWTAAQGRAWLAANNIKPIRFEPAGKAKIDPQAKAPASTDPALALPELKDTWYGIDAQNASTARIYIIGEIGGFGIDAAEFISEFNKINASKINIHIASPGGSIFQGTTIYNAIKASKKIIHTYNESTALSMGSVLLLAGQKVFMRKNALLMIHNPMAAIRGDEEELKRGADVLSKMKQNIAEIYQGKTGIAIETINKLMDSETWYNAGEALEDKFIDEIAGETKATNTFDLSKYNYKNIAAYETFKNTLSTPKPKQEDRKMTLAELKEKHPELYQSAVDEAKPGLIEEGRQAGIEENKAAAIEAGKKTTLQEDKEAAAKAERERIQAIEKIEAGDFQKIVDDNKFKPEENADTISAKILVAQDAAKKAAGKDIKKDGEKLADDISNIDGASPTSTEEENDNALAAAIAKGGNEENDAPTPPAK